LHNQNITFNKIIAPINRKKFKVIVHKYFGDVAVKSFSCWQQFIAVLFGQLSESRSLREIETGLNCNENLHYHLGISRISRSTLSYANRTRDWRIFRDLFFDLIEELQQKDIIQTKDVVSLIDSTPIMLLKRGHKWAESTMKITGLKVHLVYNLSSGIPTYFEITGARTNDVNVSRTLEIQRGFTYVFDKGYTDYNWWYEINSCGAFFVTRLKKNAKTKVLQENSCQGNILQDEIILLSNQHPRGGKTNNYSQTPLRRVVVNRADKDTPLVLITNDFKRSAEEIAELYKQRWQIELFFKWIKQNLKIKKFIGTNENAIRSQICIALIGFVLLRLANILQTICKQISMKNLIVIVKNTMFVKERIYYKPNVYNKNQLLFNFVNSC